MTTNTVTAYTPRDNGKNYAGDKPMIGAYSLIVTDAAGKPSELVTLRLHGSRGSSRVYASAWLRGHGYGAGHGYAGGHGYCRQSAAASAALASAGFRFAQAFDGHGMGAVRDALEAIGRWAGYADGQMAVIEHG